VPRCRSPHLPDSAERLQGGRLLRRPQQDYPAATVVEYCSAVLRHVVTVVHNKPSGTLSIRTIERVTHWDKRFGHPMQDGKSLFFDPDDVNHVFFVSYLMDPQGRLLGRDHEVIANSVVDLQEQHNRWRDSVVIAPTGFDIQPMVDGQFELICKAGDIHTSCGTFRTRTEAVKVAREMSCQSA
ncbi:hypothetical protein OSJ57_03230, partial [Sphingomonas sp. HH69]